MKNNVIARSGAMWLSILISLAVLLSFGQAFAASFTDNGDGTVTDNVTTLMWQKCSKGQANDASCSGTAGTLTWESAITYCETLSLAGHSDWRLPNIKTLRSIVDNTVTGPAINGTYFPATVSSNYWSATTNAVSTSNAWSVYFYNGYVDFSDKSSSPYVRCVRLGQ